MQITLSPRYLWTADSPPSPVPYCVTFFKRCLFVISIIYNCLCYDPYRPSYDPTNFLEWNLFDGLPSWATVQPFLSVIPLRPPSPSTFPLEFLYLGWDTRYDSQLGGVTLYVFDICSFLEIFGSFENKIGENLKAS